MPSTRAGRRIQDGERRAARAAQIHVRRRVPGTSPVPAVAGAAKLTVVLQHLGDFGHLLTEERGVRGGERHLVGGAEELTEEHVRVVRIERRVLRASG